MGDRARGRGSRLGLAHGSGRHIVRCPRGVGVHDPSPWIFQDELLYSELAKSFAATGHFAVREVPVPAPAVSGSSIPSSSRLPGALFQNVTDGVCGGQGHQLACACRSLPIPVYLLARRLAGKHWLRRRGGAHARTSGDGLHERDHDRERLLPVFLFWVLAVVLALERPTICASSRRLGSASSPT